MTLSNIKAVFQKDIETVWEMVTSVECYGIWRSDLSRVEVLNETQFVEYTKDGYATTFMVTVTEACKRWEFDMENSNMSGHWTGIFISKGDCTEVDFTEEVTAKKLLMKPFVKGYLKKQQARFIADLERALG